MKKGKSVETLARRNFVAKNMNKFNRAATMRDRTKYTRKPKHKGRISPQQSFA